MNIFVLVKQVPDTETKIVPTADGSYVETNSIKWIMNYYDEFAVEQALLIKAQDPSANICIVRVGSIRDTEAVRTAMAMGADESILVEASDLLDSYTTAKAIKGAIEKSGKPADLILAGMQATDTDALQVPSIVAHMMNFPVVAAATGFVKEGNALKVQRPVDGGAIEHYELNAPAVVTCNERLNTPRYASLPGIMKAKKKPLAQYSLADVGVTDADRKVKYHSFSLPPEKPPGKRFDGADAAKQKDVVKEVIGLLRSEAKII